MRPPDLPGTRGWRTTCPAFSRPWCRLTAYHSFMCSHCSLGGTIRALLLLCCLLLASTASFAKLVAGRDFRNGILDAELVVIVLQQSPDSFRVEEVFLGNANKGDSIQLSGFRLFTEQQYGPDIVDPSRPTQEFCYSCITRKTHQRPGSQRILDTPSSGCRILSR